MTQEETRTFLQELATALRQLQRRDIAIQQQIERATGVDQTVISRAKNGQLKRVTEGLKRLKAYADMRIGAVDVEAKVIGAARDFYGAGGTEAELVASIQLVTRLIGRRTR